MDDGRALAEARWGEFAAKVRGEWRTRFDGVGPIFGARAPGRVDVMGGVADYSGGVVLEGTLAEAAHAAVQERDDPVLRLTSVGPEAHGLTTHVELPLDRLLPASGLVSFTDARQALGSQPGSEWTAYVAGCLYVLLATGHLGTGRARGLNVLIDSSVPVSAGVSSSAAIEVAAMAAMCALYHVSLDALETARMCQVVENRVVGAPCGIMDQVTSMLGRAGHLLRLECRPHDVLSHEAVPAAWEFVGINSHHKHSVSGSPYTMARVGAFMGLKAVQRASGRDWGGYLCSLTLEDWARWRDSVPEALTGQGFIDRFGEHLDPVTSIDPDAVYRPRACAEHPVQEQDRVGQFVELMRLAGTEADSQLLTEVGALMYEAHDSYNTHLHMGSDATDTLVALAREQGPANGIFGAKITGGGSGGTVTILCAGPRANDAVDRVCAAYGAELGHPPQVMRGTSPGCHAFGARAIVS